MTNWFSLVFHCYLISSLSNLFLDQIKSAISSFDIGFQLKLVDMTNSLPSSSLEQISNSTRNDEVILSPDQTKPTVTQGKIRLCLN